MNKITDWNKACLYCEKKSEELITLEQFADKPHLCQKCNKEFVKKMAYEGIAVDKAMHFFKTISGNSKKRIEQNRRDKIE